MPGLLFLKSDVSVIFTASLQIVVLLLVVRELASSLGLPGRIAALVSLLCVLSPVVWVGTFKNDPLFAVGVLMSLLAIDRVSRSRPGALWIAQLGTFLILGTKPSGFLHALPLCGIFLLLWFAKCWSPPRNAWTIGKLILGTAAFQGMAALVQLKNLLTHDNPIYPIEFSVAGFSLADGPIDLSGTSILEAWSSSETWSLLFSGSTRQIGVALPFFFLILGAGALASVRTLAQKLVRRELAIRRELWILGVTGGALLLWLLYFATPWSRGRPVDPTQYLRVGESMRYAIAPICLSYGLAAVHISRWFGAALVWTFLQRTFLALVLVQWTFRNLFAGPIPLILWQFVFIIGLLYCVDRLARKTWVTTINWPQKSRRILKGTFYIAVVVGTLLGYYRYLEANRLEQWEPAHQQMWTHARDSMEPGSRIASNSPQPPFAYLLLGPRLEHRLHLLNPASKKPLKEEDKRADYYYFLFRGRPKEGQEALVSLEEKGWQVLFAPFPKRGYLLENTLRTQSSTDDR